MPAVSDNRIMCPRDPASYRSWCRIVLPFCGTLCITVVSVAPIGAGHAGVAFAAQLSAIPSQSAMAGRQPQMHRVPAQAVISFLTLRTPERRAPVLGESPHDSFTSGGLALFAFAVIDPERMLEIAEFAGGLAVIAQRRAASLDGLIEHRMDCRDQPPGMVGRL